ncbi:hypothetical protein GMMP15_2140029 [Candidatus Magnetomoraceae bacterium gMMP-15]
MAHLSHVLVWIEQCGKNNTMLNIPLEIRSDFDKILKRESVP